LAEKLIRQGADTTLENTVRNVRVSINGICSIPHLQAGKTPFMCLKDESDKENLQVSSLYV
jgi:hypothetical protein